MKDYNGCYIRLAGDPTLYAVDIGQKRAVESISHMYSIGLRKIHTVTKEELDAIPFLVFESDEEE